MLQDFDYVFSENGLVAYRAGELLGVQSLSKHLGEERLKELINFMLRYMAGETTRMVCVCVWGWGGGGGRKWGSRKGSRGSHEELPQ